MPKNLNQEIFSLAHLLYQGSSLSHQLPDSSAITDFSRHLFLLRVSPSG
uniref:Uncharacterized protein n=1 Tax=Arundo donax TaxID=35708 RepID=A0A0A9CHW1_ARUDO